jgi:AcrR family transcriptional regulator
MSERALIITELKRALRERGLNYGAVAQRLGVSLPSVKRLFSRGDFSLERIELVCELIGLRMREVLERAEEHSAPANQLTLTQEREIVADPKLFLVTWLVLNRVPCEEIARMYRLAEREIVHYMIRLDRLKVIELQPGNRVRLLVSRRFSWRAGGPVQRYIHEKLLREFFASAFVGPKDEFFFHGAMASQEVLAQLKRVVRNAARECMELIERDRSVPQARCGIGLALALRPWAYSGFKQFERQ